VSAHTKLIYLVACWLVVVALSFSLPQLFRPPEGVDLAPMAGLVFLAGALILFVIAFYLLGHVLRRKATYSRGIVLLGITPMLITMSGILWIILTRI